MSILGTPAGRVMMRRLPLDKPKTVNTVWCCCRVVRVGSASSPLLSLLMAVAVALMAGSASSRLAS